MNAGAWYIPWLVVIAATVLALISDLSSRRIPNLLTGSLLVTGLAAGFGLRGWPGLLDSCAGCLLMAAPCFILFLIGGGGAGDAKLMGGVGAWLGVTDGLVALASVAAAGVLVAFAFALAGKRMRSVVHNIRLWSYGVIQVAMMRGSVASAREMMPSTDSMQKVPYGVAICLGVCIAAGGAYLWRT